MGNKCLQVFWIFCHQDTLQSCTGKYRGLQGNPCNENRIPAMKTGYPEMKTGFSLWELTYWVWVWSAPSITVRKLIYLDKKSFLMHGSVEPKFFTIWIRIFRDQKLTLLLLNKLELKTFLRCLITREKFTCGSWNIKLHIWLQWKLCKESKKGTDKYWVFEPVFKYVW